MIELLSTLTLTQALMYLALIAIAAKEFLTLKDFFKKRADSKYDNENNEKKQIENILSELKSLKEEIHKQELECQKLNTNIRDLGTYWEKRDEEHQNVLRLLIRSDMDAIKSFIVKEHHYFIEQKWIDDFSLDTIEKRYTHYKEEGGNSYVRDLIKDLRELPNMPPKN